MRRLLPLFLVLGASIAHAQEARVVAACGTLPQAYAVGSAALPTVDTNGRLCLGGSVRVLAASAVESTVHTGDTNLSPLVTIAVPANTLGANGRLRITALYRFTGTAGNKTTAVTFGGTTFYSLAQTSTSLSWRGQIEIANRNATNSQVAGPSLAATFQSATTDVTTGSVDTTALQNIVLQGQLANGGDSIAIESFLVEVIIP